MNAGAPPNGRVNPPSAADERRANAALVRARITPLVEANGADASLIEAIAGRIAGRVAVIEELAATAAAIEAPRAVLMMVRNAADDAAPNGETARG